MNGETVTTYKIFNGKHLSWKMATWKTGGHKLLARGLISKEKIEM
jgi:hypothetical protein